MKQMAAPDPQDHGPSSDGAGSPAGGCAAGDLKRGSPPIAAEAADRPPNEPFEWLEGSDTLVVFIHGFLGSPDSFRALAERLHQRGLDCAGILLPGHGGTVRNFARTGEDAWVMHVHREIERLRPGYRRLVLVGHSLGCLLSLDYAADHAGDRPADGLILYCTPLALRFRPFSLGIALALLKPPARDNPVTAAYRLSYGLCQPMLNPLALLRPTAALVFTMRRAREKLRNVVSPTLVIQSLRDETAAPESARELASKLGGLVHVHWLKRSRHAWVHPDEQPAVDAEIDRFFRIVCP